MRAAARLPRRAPGAAFHPSIADPPMPDSARSAGAAAPALTAETPFTPVPAWLRARDVSWAADLIPDLTNLEPKP